QVRLDARDVWTARKVLLRRINRRAEVHGDETSDPGRYEQRVASHAAARIEHSRVRKRREIGANEVALKIRLSGGPPVRESSPFVSEARLGAGTDGIGSVADEPWNAVADRRGLATVRARQ